jgi:uncharacterized protein DUF5679
MTRKPKADDLGRQTTEGHSARRQGGPTDMAEAYCVRDKKKVEIKDPQQITMKNGKPATKGTCPECGNSVFRIGG